ncbi:rhodanese-like domain-containing protein [Truepera radiovictrix]|uniref:Rhodanese domain protein n=1 Tax=Truepera radiovictrix (strain DSM 17093 / CIP 108686 / LMG 22925 / RQ-24) TaxID=649638 RepID=D7CWG3_TRURR|nr:rhodanese-like domain-containing protein [Truepera radiovictrix]ADI14362.1 Rhodanese domain protein [Truepera radiovictrix DSM 17093]WMT57081.1 rhodanese-like domain-containing protein [Truepera radiovictrix]
MKRLFILLAIPLIAASLGLSQRGANFETRDVAALAAQLGDAPDTFVLDVREPWEVAEGRVAQATPIPLGELAERLDELPEGETIWVICRSGNRSAQASALLSGAGFRAINVAGGMIAWERAGLPTVR